MFYLSSFEVEKLLQSEPYNESVKTIFLLMIITKPKKMAVNVIAAATANKKREMNMWCPNSKDARSLFPEMLPWALHRNFCEGGFGSILTESAEKLGSRHKLTYRFCASRAFPVLLTMHFICIRDSHTVAAGLIHLIGTEEQKNKCYIIKMYAGEWTGTIVLDRTGVLAVSRRFKDDGEKKCLMESIWYGNKVFISSVITIWPITSFTPFSARIWRRSTRNKRNLHLHSPLNTGSTIGPVLSANSWCSNTGGIEHKMGIKRVSHLHTQFRWKRQLHWRASGAMAWGDEGHVPDDEWGTHRHWDARPWISPRRLFEHCSQYAKERIQGLPSGMRWIRMLNLLP